MSPDLPLRLTIELVPQTCWYSNLRNKMSQAQWNRLRRQTYAQYGHKCGICGASGRLNCHERWRYDDVGHVQRLEGFIALCDWCHHVKHIGHAGILAQEGKLDYERVVQHFLRVNDCDRPTFEAHHAQTFATWRQRSKHQWQTDLGEYAVLIAP